MVKMVVVKLVWGWKEMLPSYDVWFELRTTPWGNLYPA